MSSPSRLHPRRVLRKRRKFTSRSTLALSALPAAAVVDAVVTAVVIVAVAVAVSVPIPVPVRARARGAATSPKHVLYNVSQGEYEYVYVTRRYEPGSPH